MRLNQSNFKYSRVCVLSFFAKHAQMALNFAQPTTSGKYLGDVDQGRRYVPV